MRKEELSSSLMRTNIRLREETFCLKNNDKRISSSGYWSGPSCCNNDSSRLRECLNQLLSRSGTRGRRPGKETERKWQAWAWRRQRERERAKQVSPAWRQARARAKEPSCCPRSARPASRHLWSRARERLPPWRALRA